MQYLGSILYHIIETHLLLFHYVTIILIIDTLASRQILPYGNNSLSYLFMLNVIISYGIAPWILIAYISKIIKHITSANSFVKRIVQFTCNSIITLNTRIINFCGILYI
jgi:hypothetical protein